MQAASSKVPAQLDPHTAGVPLVDMSRQYQALAAEITVAVKRVLESGRYILGPDCEALEKSIAAYCHVPHAIGCASGSDAILLALMAVCVGPGDEVILPSYTFFATASAVARLGAKPVFVDIDPASFNIDPAQISAAITSATRAIMPVHLFGQCADMDAVSAIAARHKLSVVEDAAQAIGAEFKARPAGSMGDIGCFSFYPDQESRRARRWRHVDDRAARAGRSAAPAARTRNATALSPPGDRHQQPARQPASGRAQREAAASGSLDGRATASCAALSRAVRRAGPGRRARAAHGSRPSGVTCGISTWCACPTAGATRCASI